MPGAQAEPRKRHRARLFEPTRAAGDRQLENSASVLEFNDIECARGQAWAFEQTLGLVGYYRTSNPVMSRIGLRTLERIRSDSEVDRLN